jgi:hypothetical protein
LQRQFKRTALAQAAPEVFEKQLRESVLNNAGNGETRVERQDGRIVVAERATLTENGRQALRETLRDFINIRHNRNSTEGEKTNPVSESDVNAMLDRLQKTSPERYNALIEAFGGGEKGRAGAQKELSGEISHFEIVRARSVLPQSAYTPQPGDPVQEVERKKVLADTIGQQAERYRCSGQTYGGLENHPEMTRQTRGLSDTTTGAWDGGKYSTSPEEVKARRTGAAEALKQIVRDLKIGMFGDAGANANARDLLLADEQVKRLKGVIAESNLLERVVESVDKARAFERAHNREQSDRLFEAAQDNAIELLERLSPNDPNSKAIVDYLIKNNRSLS